MLETLNTLFSMVFICDKNLALVHINSPLQKYLPNTNLGSPITELFSFSRPNKVQSLNDIIEHKGSLFLLIKKDQSFALRGQMMCVLIDGVEQVVFAGSPWLAWLKSKRPSLRLGLQDFAAADAQMDQLFYISTEQQMVSDLESLNAELLQAKSEVEAAHAKTNAFYAQMSHEMRTPLNGVVSALAILAEQNLPSNSSELVNMANRSSKNLLQVINYVLDTARLEAGYLDDIQVSFNLKSLLNSTIEIVRPHTLDKDLLLELSVANDLPKNFIGFKDRLRQVLLNLLSNAVKFTQTGLVSLVATKPKSSKYSIRLEVTDTGAGIAAESIDKVFTPFYTSVPNDTHSEIGTGLGLDIAKRSVGLLGGEIGVESNLHKGSTFWVEIPLDPDNVQIEAATKEETLNTSTDLLSGEVLVVEDNKTNSILCKILLESLGVSVRSEYSAEDAIVAIKHKKPDLVFMDIGLQGMDGHQATTVLRQTYSHEELPILALTAYTNSEEYEKSVEAGMDDYLTKPVNKELFREALVNWLPNKPLLKADDVKYFPDLLILAQLEEQIGKDNLQILAKQFCEEARVDFYKLQVSTENLDIAKAAHKLISPCDSFALPKLAEQFRSIEQNAKSGQLLKPMYLKSLKVEFDKALITLQDTVNA
jgi:signal transduction histidine kinase/DNA-binding NarL/FixJ family response regulator